MLHVVQHGIDVNGNGKYDVEGAGISTFAKNLGVPGVPRRRPTRRAAAS